MLRCADVATPEKKQLNEEEEGFWYSRKQTAFLVSVWEMLSGSSVRLTLLSYIHSSTFTVYQQ